MNKALAVCLWWLASTFAYSATVNMLSCCPGEDTATEARFVWHSDSNACTFWYAKAAAPGDAMQATCESAYKPVSFRSNDVNYYKYTAELSGLEPGMEYIYYVKSGSTQFATQKFKTAGTSGSYNFLWMSDVHSHPDNPGKMTTVELLRQDAESRTASSGGIDFVLFSGDAVKYGSRYDNWQQWNGVPTVTNYTFAIVPGNKEYYYTGSSTFYDYYWYLAVKNNPQNGPGTTEQEGCYWFIRDSVLFVGIDSLIHKGSRMTRYNDKTNVLREQTNWFDRVVSEQASRKSFRYLVVVQHDPWFVYAATKDSFDKSRGNYDTWRHIFDKHKVDLALSGDEHNYIRTKPLRGDSANSDGTIYMVAGQIEEENYSATITKDVSSYGNASATKYFDCMGATDASCGAAWFEVRPTSLKVVEFWDKYQSPNYKEYDSFEIVPKDRGFEYSPPVAVKGFDGNPHGRYRFTVDAPRSDTESMQLSEINLFDANGNVISTNTFTLAYDSTTKDSYGYTYPSGESPNKAADGDLDTKWLDWRAGLSQSAAVRSVVWLDFCFEEPMAVYGYRWYTAGDNSTYFERTPASWTFSSSDDGGVTWSVIDKVVGYDTTHDDNTLAYSKNIDFLPTSDKWLEETAEMRQVTGRWSETIVYGEDGRAFLDSDAGEIAFTPCTASTGNVVTVETTMQFHEYSRDYALDADVQAAVRLGTNGCFQVWRGTGNGERIPRAKRVAEGDALAGVGMGNGWMDVEAEGVTPVSGEEYTLRVTFDYAAGTYGVEVKTGLTEFTRLREKENPVNPVNPVKTNFPLAFSTNCVTSFSFIGDTYFTSLVGDCRYEIIGFVADEALALSNNVEVVLSAVKAAWLNKCGGDKAAVQRAAGGLSEKEFDDAYLLNLDIADGSRSYAFAITDIAVGDTSVTVSVTLTRSGKIGQAINGTLKFYGAATLADFKAAASPLGSAVISDDNFSDGDSASAAIQLDGDNPPTFFNAKIEE